MVGLAVHPIDLEPFRLGSERDRREVAAAIDLACQGTGFLQLTGHGVARSLLNEVLDETEVFFDQPLETKLRCVVPDRSANRGYAAEGTEALAYSMGDEPPAPDLFEAFNAGWDRPSIEGDYLQEYGRFYAPNVWPDEPPGLSAVWARYQAAIGEVADHLLGAFALALELDSRFFLDRTRRAIVTTRAINYQRRTGAPGPVPGQMGMGAHTDYGVLTVLNADDVPGLEVFHQGAWEPVSIPAGNLMVNIGDMLATWTNDRWVSTLHRVIPHDVEERRAGPGRPRRRSVAQFFEADPDCVISCLPSCADPANPPRHPAVTAGDYLLSKLLGPRELRKSDWAGHPLP